MFSGSGQFVQYCFVVVDIDKAIQRWVQTTGAGPFFLLRHVNNLDIRYRGKRAELDISIALGQAGGAHIELIQQHNNGPSIYRETYHSGEEGFHHVAMLAADYPKALNAYKAAGFAIGMEGHFGRQTSFAYVDATNAIGAFIELVQETDEVKALYAAVAEASRGWNGLEPVRSF